MIRTENDINIIIKKLGYIWKKYPNLRLGQLLVNFIDIANLFYIEDNNLLTRMASCYKVDLNDFVPTEINNNTDTGITNKGKVFIHKGDTVKLVSQAELPNYVKEGFKLGMKDKWNCI